MPGQRTTTIPRTGATQAEFCSTRWSAVLAAGRPGQPGAAEALGALCRAYWYPLYVYVRRRGHPPAEAQDLTQEFFARLIEKNVVQVADPERGRFRSFLLASLANFLNNEWDRSRAVKRGAAYEMVSWDAQTAEERYLQEPRHEETPEKVFEQRWALTVLDQALGLLRAEYSRAGKGEIFETLQVCLSGGRPPEPYAGLGGKLGLSEPAVRVAVHRLRQRFGAMLRHVVSQTLGQEENLDEELRHLASRLG